MPSWKSVLGMSVVRMALMKGWLNMVVLIGFDNQFRSIYMFHYGPLLNSGINKLLNILLK